MRVTPIYFNSTKNLKTSTAFSRNPDCFVKNSFKSGDVVCLSSKTKDTAGNPKEKHNTNPFRENVIVYPFKNSQSVNFKGSSTKSQESGGLYAITASPSKSRDFINEIACDPAHSNVIFKNLLNKYGFQSFSQWYFSPNGYYGAYEKFVEELYTDAKSIDELLKFQPNWAPWKLEEKAWLLDNSSRLPSLSPEKRKKEFDNYCDTEREFPFVMGAIPLELGDGASYQTLIRVLKTQDIRKKSIGINNTHYQVERLKGGELNNKFIYLVQSGGRKFIVKLERTNIEDLSDVESRKLSNYEKRTIRSNKYLSPDSVFANACVSRYLGLNGCNSIPALLYYNHHTHSSVYEYIEAAHGDGFQNDLIDKEYMNLSEMNSKYSDVSKLGIYLNDTDEKNSLTDKDGFGKIVDLGHCAFINLAKPGVKHYNIEFSNSNGPDLRSIYAGILLASL